ncbi:hypothetical protein CK503_08870 [Aliifodinibius salipaludis]|uniref:Uncharacterized protein n=1 Tax=Fodinibius salipaludis TaxID=2032627 RepID=A0A2A2G7P4_9BACT|nr:hypothetical protein [Aliifodinibius salipaludis]PAU93776.1 hypothetical protein CK503_08870 [Aliifodinibius salipaludis]
MSKNTEESERKLKPIRRAEILLIKTLHGFDSAEDEYGYDLANERYFVEEALKSIREEANEPEKDSARCVRRGASGIMH